jgi:hypothetical protein
MKRWLFEVGRNGSPGIDTPLGRRLGWLAVAALVVFQLVRMVPCLWMPWFQNSDELVMGYEAIRFMRLDFHQHFFDIPGTPFMALTALLWAAGHRILLLCGLIDMGGPSSFAFAHLDGLFALMRAEVLAFYAGSIALTYVLGRRLSNVCGGCVAALMLATLPTYCGCCQLARTESMGICLSLAAVYWAMRARETGKMRFPLLAGLAAGVATTCRFHCALATLPVLLGVHFLYRPACPATQEADNRDTRTPRPYLVLAGGLVAVFFIGALLVVAANLEWIHPGRLCRAMLIASTRDHALLVPHALRLMRGIWLALGVGLPCVYLAYFVPRLRRPARFLVDARVITLLAAFCAGFVLSGPTFLWQGNHQLRSIEFYSHQYDDVERAHLGFWANAWYVTSHLFRVANPEPWVIGGCLAGAAVVILRRDRALWPILIGALAAFASQKPGMLAAEHHILPWMPYFALLQGYAIAALWQVIAERAPPRPVLRLGLLATVLVAVVYLMLPRLKIDYQARVTQVVQRCGTVTETTAWIDQQTPPRSEIFLSYLSFNEQCFFMWMACEGVYAPEWRWPGTRFYWNWWGDRALLRGRRGYLVATAGELEQCAKQSVSRPGLGVDPAHDAGFRALRSFGPEGPFRITVFAFDLRAEGGH